ncbi:MAG: alpha/beta fold hydrolase [Acidimicrobiales bacterium]
MATLEVGDVELCYELQRRHDEPVILLISGLGGQLISWDDDFCDLLVKEGFGVLRFDNRDVGLSTSFDPAGAAELDLSSGISVDTASAPYDLVDMAGDAAGLLGAVGIDAAHVVGVSMGGMIAQQLAISHPEKVLSLCSIMSMTGAPDAEPPTAEALRVLIAPPPEKRDAYIDNQVEVWKVIGSPGFPFDEGRIRRRAAAGYDRSFRPAGVGRQLLGILASPDRTEALGGVKVPTLVIHGEEDPLVRLSGGVATAAAVPGSTLVRVPGMGHDLPPEVWRQVVAAIADNARAVTRT